LIVIIIFIIGTLTFEDSAFILFGKGQQNTGGLSSGIRLWGTYLSLDRVSWVLASKTVGSDESQSKRNAHKLASDKNNAPTSGVSERGSSTYSLISFSFSKGLLGVSKVLESRDVSGVTLTTGVLLWHFEGLIYGVSISI
jgi:hypothetical protein